MGPRRNRAILPRLQRREARPRLVMANVDAALRAIIMVISSVPNPHPITPLHGPHTLAVPAVWAHTSQTLHASISSTKSTSSSFVHPEILLLQDSTQSPLPPKAFPYHSILTPEFTFPLGLSTCLGPMRHQGLWGLSTDREPKGRDQSQRVPVCSRVPGSPKPQPCLSPNMGKGHCFWEDDASPATSRGARPLLLSQLHGPGPCGCRHRCACTC